MYKCYIIIEFMFLKVLMLIRQVLLRKALFATIVIFSIKGLGFNQLSVMVVIRKWCLLTLTILLF